jgi:hypothetical protein
MDSLREAALDYARRGWPVFPLRPRGKEPLGALVAHGLKDATTDAQTIGDWWGQQPEANVGLRTGDVFDVLDIDGPDDGTTELVRLVGEHGGDALEGPTAITGSGHHLFVQPSGRGNRAKFVAGCDWRGRGGYVVAPPSVHPSGRRYHWLEHGPDTPLLPAPEWLVALLDPPMPLAPVIPMEPKRMTDASAYARAAFVNECANVAAAPVGSRNHVLNTAAFSLGRFVGGGLLDVDDVTSGLRAEALRVGLSQREAQRTIESGLLAGIREPRRAPA